jgi:hypothetical protein
LEFKEGLQGRPILRRAGEDEQLSEAGTTVRVWLDRTVTSDGGLLSSVVQRGRDFRHVSAKAPNDLRRLCAWLCPASDVSIHVEVDGAGKVQVVAADDWKTISGAKLLDRILGDSDETNRSELCENLGDAIRPVESSDGHIVARLGVRTFKQVEKSKGWERQHAIGVVTAGAHRAFGLADIAGIVLGRAATASRQQASLDLEAESMAAWASQQVEIVDMLAISDKAKKDLANDIRGFGGETGTLPIAFCHDGWLTVDEIGRKAWPDEIVLVNEDSWSRIKKEAADAELSPNVLAVKSARTSSSFLFRCGHASRANHDNWKFICGNLEGAILEAVAMAWDSSLQLVLDASEFHSDEHEVAALVGRKGDGEEISCKLVSIIRKPSAS